MWIFNKLNIFICPFVLQWYIKVCFNSIIYTVTCLLTSVWMTSNYLAPPDTNFLTYQGPEGTVTGPRGNCGLSLLLYNSWLPVLGQTLCKLLFHYKQNVFHFKFLTLNICLICLRGKQAAKVNYSWHCCSYMYVVLSNKYHYSKCEN